MIKERYMNFQEQRGLQAIHSHDHDDGPELRGQRLGHRGLVISLSRNQPCLIGQAPFMASHP